MVQYKNRVSVIGLLIELLAGTRLLIAVQNLPCLNQRSKVLNVRVKISCFISDIVRCDFIFMRKYKMLSSLFHFRVLLFVDHCSFSFPCSLIFQNKLYFVQCTVTDDCNDRISNGVNLVSSNRVEYLIISVTFYFQEQKFHYWSLVDDFVNFEFDGSHRHPWGRSFSRIHCSN